MPCCSGRLLSAAGRQAGPKSPSTSAKPRMIMQAAACVYLITHGLLRGGVLNEASSEEGRRTRSILPVRMRERVHHCRRRCATWAA